MNDESLFAEMFDHLPKALVFANEFKSGFWSDTPDRFQIIATKEYTQINELRMHHGAHAYIVIDTCAPVTCPSPIPPELSLD
jgi:hypothetical protein